MLRKLFGFRRRYKPDFRDASVVADLEASSASFASFRKQDLSGNAARDSIARYFRSDRTSKFFADSHELASLAGRIGREHPAWRRSLFERIVADRDEGLPIYARRGPRLRPGFPWGELEAGPGQDKLYRKRPHRFAFVPRAALAVLCGGLTNAALEAVLVDWTSYADARNNRFAYDSNLAVIQRILASSWAWAFLSARTATPSADELQLEGLLLRILYTDIRFLAPRLGHSFANNHLLADAFAGWFVGVVWPELAPEPDWENRFESLWLHELRRQTLADGTSFEHSTHYHEYACEMATAYISLKRRNGGIVETWVSERIGRMLAFQTDLGGTEAFPLMIGDAAEDPLFVLDNGNGWGTAAWRELYRALVADDIAAVNEQGASMEKAFWLLGGVLRPPASASGSAARATHRLRAYPLGGFYMFMDAVADARLVFRTGPNRSESISAGHAHADLLSVYLTIGGAPILVDAGTYTYRSNTAGWPEDAPRWRHYFRGPRAHSTLSLDGADPLGEADGDFRSAEPHAHVEVSRSLNGSGVKWVDGIVRGQKPYDSYRRGVIHLPGEYWVVYDVVPDVDSGSDRSFGFQFAPGCSVEADRHSVVVTLDGTGLSLVGSQSLRTPSCFLGSLNPLAGWVSRRYGYVEPAPQVRFEIPPKLRTTAFLLRCESDAGDATIDATEISPSSVEVTIQTGLVRDTLLLNFGSRNDAVRTRGNMTFYGHFAWVRSIGGRTRTVRWLNGRFFDWPGGGVAISGSKWEEELELSQFDGGLRARHCELDALSVNWPI